MRLFRLFEIITALICHYLLYIFFERKMKYLSLVTVSTSPMNSCKGGKKSTKPLVSLVPWSHGPVSDSTAPARSTGKNKIEPISKEILQTSSRLLWLVGKCRKELCITNFRCQGFNFAVFPTLHKGLWSSTHAIIIGKWPTIRSKCIFYLSQEKNSALKMSTHPSWVKEFVA